MNANSKHFVVYLRENFSLNKNGKTFFFCRTYHICFSVSTKLWQPPKFDSIQSFSTLGLCRSPSLSCYFAWS